MDSQIYSTAYKFSYLLFIVPNVLVFLPRFSGAWKKKKILQDSLKKNAAGSIIQTILIITYSLLEQGQRGIIPDYGIRLLFLGGSLFGAALVMAGYIQIFRSSKKFSFSKWF